MAGVTGGVLYDSGGVLHGSGGVLHGTGGHIHCYVQHSPGDESALSIAEHE